MNLQQTVVEKQRLEQKKYLNNEINNDEKIKIKIITNKQTLTKLMPLNKELHYHCIL